MPLRFAIIWLMLATATLARGESQSFTTTFDSAGNQTGVTWHTRDGQYELIIEDLSDLQSDDESESSLIATVVSGEGEKQQTLWRTKLSGRVFEYSEPERLYLSARGDYFVVVPMWGYEDLTFRVFTEKGTKALVTPKPIEEETTPREWITGLETIDGIDVLRIWNQKDDGWFAFTLPDGNQFHATPADSQRWSEATRRKIRQAFAARDKEEFRDRFIESDPVLQRLASILPSASNHTTVNDVDYEFLLRRRNPDDRKLFEAMLRKRSQVGNRAVGFACNFGRQSVDDYTFTSDDFEREQADSILARWDEQIETNIARALEMPHLLARLSGIVRLPCPILANAGTIYIHLVPCGQQHRRWTNSPTAEYLQCAAPGAHEDQSELVDEVEFSFGAITPGKYLLKAVWDKRAPFNDVTRAGPGDYESEFVPLTLTAGDAMTGLTVPCANQAAGGESYYAADAVALERWKIIGDLTPASFAADNGDGGEFSRSADQWIVKTNRLPPTPMPRLVRIALGHIAELGTPVEPRSQSVRGLKIFFAEKPNPTEYCPYQFEIIDEHGCIFRAREPFGLFGRAVALFPRFPRSSKTFRLIATDSSDAPVWDATVTNLAGAHFAPKNGAPLPVTKNLGPVTLSILEVGLPGHSAGAVNLAYEFRGENGIRVADWDLVDRELIDEAGMRILDYGFCRDEANVRLKAAAVRTYESAPAKWIVNLTKMPAPGEFLPFDQTTNLCGIRLTVIGVVGKGESKLTLPAYGMNGIISVTADAAEVEIVGRRATVKSQWPRLAVMAPQNFRQTILYFRGDQSTTEHLTLAGQSNPPGNQLMLIPLKCGAADDHVQLEFRAAQKIPLEFNIQPPSEPETRSSRLSAVSPN